MLGFLDASVSLTFIINYYYLDNTIPGVVFLIIVQNRLMFTRAPAYNS